MRNPLQGPRLMVVPLGDGNDRDDDALMLAARAGEKVAFDALVRRHQRKIIGFAQKFFYHSSLANDVAQDVFVDLMRAIPNYRPEGKFVAFLYRLTLNRCRMAARGRRYEEDSRQALEPSEPSVPDHERNRRVQIMMMKLTEKQREILLLRFWSGLSHEEMGQALGIRIGTVKSRLFGALSALRREVSS